MYITAEDSVFSGDWHKQSMYKTEYFDVQKNTFLNTVTFVYNPSTGNLPEVLHIRTINVQIRLCA